MKKVTLRSLFDNAAFKISKYGVSYKLLRKDKKSKTATYQSTNSGLTFEKPWGNKVFIVEYH